MLLTFLIERVFAVVAQLIKYLTLQGNLHQILRRKYTEVIPSSCLSYLSADGGPPLSLKRCRGQSQSRDGWGESLPVA